MARLDPRSANVSSDLETLREPGSADLQNENGLGHEIGNENGHESAVLNRADATTSALRDGSVALTNENGMETGDVSIHLAHDTDNENGYVSAVLGQVDATTSAIHLTGADPGLGSQQATEPADPDVEPDVQMAHSGLKEDAEDSEADAPGPGVHGDAKDAAADADSCGDQDPDTQHRHPNTQHPTPFCTVPQGEARQVSGTMPAATATFELHPPRSIPKEPPKHKQVPERILVQTQLAHVELSRRPRRHEGLPSEPPDVPGDGHGDGFVYYACDEDSVSTLGFDTTSCASALLDIGASRNVVGLRAARALLRACGRTMQPVTTPRRFRLGDHILPAIGPCLVSFRTPGGVIDLAVDVVEADVPLLIGLDAMDSHLLQVLTISNELQHIPVSRHGAGWCMAVSRRGGHVWLDFEPLSDEDVHYTKAELSKLHRHLYHPASAKMYNLLRKADPKNLPADTRTILDGIVRACHRCQEFARSPMRFKIRLPGNVEFNRDIRLGLVFLECKPGLHIVVAGTTYNAAVFLQAQDAASVWNAFVKGWSRLYIGDPERILADQGSVFRSDMFGTLYQEHDIRLEFTGTESHNSLGVGERYHDPLRRTYMKLRADYQVAVDVLLQCAVSCCARHRLTSVPR